MRRFSEQRILESLSRGWLGIVVVALVCAAVGVLVAKGYAVVVAVPVLLGIFAAAAPEQRIAAALVLVFFPFTVGSVGPVPRILLGELFIPVAFPALVFVVSKSGKPLVPTSGRLYAVASVVLVGLTAFRFAIGPLFGSLNGSIAFGSSGLRPFFDLTIYSMLFFETMWLVDMVPKRRECWIRFVWVLLSAALIIGTLRVATGILGVDTPLLTGTFDYGGRTALVGGLTAFRIGGLAESASLGLASLGALWLMRAISPPAAMAASFWLLVIAGLSGGRSFILGLAAAALLYLIGPGRGSRMRVIVVSIVAIGVTAYMAYSYGFAAQFTRLASLQGGIEAQDPTRYQVIRILWGYFWANPLFGKGIGVAGEGLANEFIAAQVLAGGHSSYASILGNFGLVGGFFLVVFVYGPLVKALRQTRITEDGRLQGWIHGLLGLILIDTSIRALEYVAGGTGYNDPRMYITAGLFVVIASALISEERHAPEA